MRRGAFCLWLLAGCNQLLGIEDVKGTDDPTADSDGDGLPNFQDNCPAVANADQANADGDPFGDACDKCVDGATDADGDGVQEGTAVGCDLCPITVSPRNHDEDHDGAGDECDLCPTFPGPQSDKDGDGIGGDCDPGGAVQELALFDPFTPFDPTDPRWSMPGTQWVATADGEATEPVAESPRFVDGLIVPTAFGLRDEWLISVGIEVPDVTAAGARLGLLMQDASGGTARFPSHCLVTCEAGKPCHVTDEQLQEGGVELPPGEYNLVLSVSTASTLYKAECRIVGPVTDSTPARDFERVATKATLFTSQPLPFRNFYAVH